LLNKKLCFPLNIVQNYNSVVKRNILLLKSDVFYITFILLKC